MILGAFVTWKWLPEMPTWQAASKLDELARSHSWKQYSSGGLAEDDDCSKPRRQLHFSGVGGAGP